MAKIWVRIPAENPEIENVLLRSAHDLFPQAPYNPSEPLLLSVETFLWAFMSF